MLFLNGFFRILPLNFFILSGLMTVGLLSFSSCHKEDPNGYRFSTREFIILANQEMLFQQALVLKFKQASPGVANLKIFADRGILADVYLQELKIYAGQYQIVPAPLLNEEYNHKLNTIKAGGTDIATLAALSDQILIGLHIRAASNSGVDDSKLREWADSWLPRLTHNLSGLQNLR